MIQTNIPNLTNEEIILEIEQEIKRQETYKQQSFTMPKTILHHTTIKKNKLYLFATKIGKFLQKRGFDSFTKEIQKIFKLYPQNRIYTMHDFVKFYDEEFINNAYNIIFYRAPKSDEKNHYLSLLRSGKSSKMEIIVSIYFSKEAREQNIIILGIKKRYLIAQLYKIPFVGYIIKIFITLFTIPKLLARISSYENFFYSKIQHQELKQNDLEFELQTKASKDSLSELSKHIEFGLQTKASKESLSELSKYIESELKTKAHIEDFKHYMQMIDYAKEYIKISQKNLLELIDEAKKRLPNGQFTQKELLEISQEQKHIFDSFYVAFEDRFRGSRDEIKQRAKQYLPYIENLPFDKEGIKILDIGCGRGEWLELLKENGYFAKGIDLNTIMVEKSQQLSLSVENADAIEYLRSQQNNSISSISGFHIIEHLPFEVLMELFEQSYRVLQKGGIVIFETPNPENLVVGACTFYTDPTHKNPLVPDAAQFLLDYVGFSNTHIKRINGTFNVDLKNDFLNQHFNSSFDYAIIGYKV